MTENAKASNDLATLRAAVDELAARLDRIEAQGNPPSPLASVESRLVGAWSALRGGPQEAPPSPASPTSPRRGLLWPILTLCAILLALILAVELAEDLSDSLWHLGRWID